MQSAAQLNPDQKQQLARREAALLSMPLKSTNSGSDGGMFGWVDSLSQPWTEHGKPPPQPLHRNQVAAERVTVHALQQQLQQQLAELPTSIDIDQHLLEQLELHGSSAILGNGSKSADAAGTQSSSTSTNGGSSSSSSVQQRRQVRLQQQQAGAAPRPLSTPAHLVDDRPPSTARLMAAVRARMEHKLLLQEGLTVLQQYEQYLAAKFGC